MSKILVTGGAGFIGSHTVDLLISKGYEVRILDNLERQVHGEKRPEYLNKKAELMLGDVTKIDSWEKALSGVDCVVHLAAMVGVGQSMYEPTKYISVNSLGTAAMYEAIIKKRLKPEKIVIASSMSIYGEGAYRCSAHGIVYPGLRSKEQMEKGDWEIHCTKCDKHVIPIPTTEEKPQQNLSTYALSKYDQERLALNYGLSLNIPTAAMRYFNVYGPRQSLSNPYTGVCAIFSSRIKNNKPPLVYEDGKQTRDFIYVEDVAKANVLALEKFGGVDAFNIGTGVSVNILDIARTLAELYGSSIEPKVSGEYRLGDIRHAVGDVSKAKKLFGFEHHVKLKDGLRKLFEWGETQKAVDRFDEAEAERKRLLSL